MSIVMDSVTYVITCLQRRLHWTDKLKERMDMDLASMPERHAGRWQSTLTPIQSIADLGAAVRKQQTFKNRPEHEIAEQDIVHRLDCVKCGLNRNHGLLT